MEYTKLYDILGEDTKTKSFIANLASGYIEVPYITIETLNLLSDDSPLLNAIPDYNKKALCSMMTMYFDSCLDLYMDDLNLDKLLNFARIEVYKVEASSGIRYATVNEVAQGVRGLIAEYVYPAGEEAFKNLCILNWTFSGKPYNLRLAGYKLNYSNDGKVMTSFYEMVQMCANDIKQLFTWLEDEARYKKCIKIISKMKSSNGYKYASYEKDELSEDITIKQLIYNIRNTFPRNSTNNDYRKALALAIKAKDNRLTPMDISWLRDIYYKHALDRNRQGSVSNEVNEKLKSECAKLLEERYKGKINQKHFAYTIIDTLKNSNYTKCSPKQYSVIEDALKIINSADKKDDISKKTEVVSDNEIDMTLSSLSDAIGNGLFEEGDDTDEE